MSKKKLYSTLAATTVLAATVVAPYATQAEENYTAAKQGLYVTTANGEGNLFYTLTEVLANPELVVDLIRTHGGANVHFVVAGEYTTASKISTAASAGQDLASAYVAQSPTTDVPVGSYTTTDGKQEVVGEDSTPGDTIESVSAITGSTIKSGTETTLKFLVNGEELTKAEFEEKYEGYTAEFKYNYSPVSTKERTGVVTKTAAFKYAVQVTDAEGENVNTLTAADYAEVKVLTTATVTEVTGVELSNDLDYVTVGETASIELVEALNAFGEEVEGQTLVGLGATIKSSDVTIAYANGNDGVEITARKVGNVTFTVEFPEASKIAPVTLTVEVKAAQKATSIKAEDLKVQVANDNSYATKYTVLDQNGEELREPEASSFTETVEVTNEAGNAVTTFAAKGVYTVTVYADSDKKVKLGSYKVTTVDVAEGEIDTFEFSTDKNFLLDRNPAALTGKNQIVKLAGYIDGVEVDPTEKLEGYVLRSSNEDVFTVEETPAVSNQITAVGVGTATLSLVKEEGDIVTVVETIELEVVNSTPQITSLQLKGDASAILVADATELTAAKIASQVTAGVDTEGNEIFKPTYIKDVEYVAANQKVIVTLDSLYGGAEFTFDVVIDTDAPTITSATVGTATASITQPTETTTGTITFTVDPAIEYTTGTVAVSEENVKAIITYGNPIEVLAPTVEALLTAFKADGKVLGSTLITESAAGVPVTLVDAVGNETNYTVKFVAAPAQ